MKDVTDYALRGGKRLASCSTLLTYKGFTNDVNEQILDVCTGVELYRHAILVTTISLTATSYGVEPAPFKRCTLSAMTTVAGVAVFTGNILYTLALKAMMRTDFETNKIAKILTMLNNAFQAVNDSQLLDLLFEYKIPDVHEWYIMASKRAASLFNASLGIGAVLAEASERDVQLLEVAALPIGYCFDIQDDIIDTFAEEEQYGRRPARICTSTRNRSTLSTPTKWPIGRS